MFGERGAIYLSPIAQRGIPVGDLIAPEATNFLIFKLGDFIFPADNPSYTDELLESYIHRLWRYMSFSRLTVLLPCLTVSRYLPWVDSVGLPVQHS